MPDELLEVFRTSLWHGATHIIIPMMLIIGVIALIVIIIEALLDRLARKMRRKIILKRRERKRNKIADAKKHGRENGLDE